MKRRYGHREGIRITTHFGHGRGRFWAKLPTDRLLEIGNSLLSLELCPLRQVTQEGSYVKKRGAHNGTGKLANDESASDPIEDNVIGRWRSKDRFIHARSGEWRICTYSSFVC